MTTSDTFQVVVVSCEVIQTASSYLVESLISIYLFEKFVQFKELQELRNLVLKKCPPHHHNYFTQNVKNFDNYYYNIRFSRLFQGMWKTR